MSASDQKKWLLFPSLFSIVPFLFAHETDDSRDMTKFSFRLVAEWKSPYEITSATR